MGITTGPDLVAIMAFSMQAHRACKLRDSQREAWDTGEKRIFSDICPFAFALAHPSTFPLPPSENKLVCRGVVRFRKTNVNHYGCHEDASKA